MFNSLELIKKTVEKAKNFPNPAIEYNLEIPKAPGINAGSFFGVKAVENKKLAKNTTNIIYKLI